MSLFFIKGLGSCESVLRTKDGEFREESITASKDRKGGEKEVPISGHRKFDYFCGVVGKFSPRAIFIYSAPVDSKLDFDEVSLRMGKLEKQQRAKEREWR